MNLQDPLGEEDERPPWFSRKKAAQVSEIYRLHDLERARVLALSEEQRWATAALVDGALRLEGGGYPTRYHYQLSICRADDPEIPRLPDGNRYYDCTKAHLFRRADGNLLALGAYSSMTAVPGPGVEAFVLAHPECAMEVFTAHMRAQRGAWFREDSFVPPEGAVQIVYP